MYKVAATYSTISPQTKLGGNSGVGYSWYNVDGVAASKGVVVAGGRAAADVAASLLSHPLSAHYYEH